MPQHGKIDEHSITKLIKNSHKSQDRMCIFDNRRDKLATKVCSFFELN